MVAISNKVLRDEIRCEREQRYHNLELVTNEYLKNPEHPHTSFIYANLMECDPRCAEILNVSSGIFNKIVKTYQNAVGPMISEYEVDSKEIVEHLTANGVVGLEKYKEESEDKFEVIPSDEVYYTNGIPTRIVEFQILNVKKQEYDYYLIKRFYEIGKTYTHLYKMDSKKSLYGTEIDITSIAAESELGRVMVRYQAEEITGFDVPALHIVEYDNIFDIIKSLVFAIERKIVSSDNQVIQFIKEKLLLKGFKKMSDKELEDDTWYQDSEASAEYLSKENPYVMQSWEIIEKQLKLISADTNIPLDDFGFEISSSLGQDAQAARRVALDQKVETFRTITENMIYFFEGSDVQISWNSANYTDRTTLLEEFKLARECGVMSQLDLVMEFWDLDQEAAQEKLNEINQIDGPEPIESQNV